MTGNPARATPPPLSDWRPFNRRVLTSSSDEWPESLNELGPLPPPSEIYVYGAPIDATKNAVAIVGTRRPTIAGIEAAEHFAARIAEASFIVVSGLALGIDAIAHRAALDAGGQTIAVIGCGANLNYPKRNEQLRRRIDAGGTIVSEYREGTPPLPHHFPMRNRIIVGLCRAVLVIEGGQGSGALITARAGIDANRDVFAVPGSRRNPAAFAPNELIRTCQATAVTDASHVFEELAPVLIWSEGVARAAPVQLDEPDAGVLMLLDDAPLSPDTIVRRLGLPQGEVALALSRLEVRGLAVRGFRGYQITGAGARVRERIQDD